MADKGGASGDKIEELMKKEEDDVIVENLVHFDRFLDNLKEKGVKNISLKHIDRISQLKQKLSEVVPQKEFQFDFDILKKFDKDKDAKAAAGDDLDLPKNEKDTNKVSVKSKKKSEKEASSSEDSESSKSSESSGDYCSFTASGISDSDTSGSVSAKKKKNKKKKIKKKSNDEKPQKNIPNKDDKPDDEKKTGLELLVRALTKLDGRKVPAQEKFDERTGQDLKRYLKKFESYCESNFKGDRDLWIGQLELHLTGKVLDAMKAVRDADDSYEKVRDKLLEWYGNMKDLRKKKNRSNYEKAQFIKGESLYLYSTRLERLYKLAFPNHIIKNSKSIQEKFQSSIPKSARSLLSSQIMSHKVNNRKITWKLIQQCARYYDLDKEKSHLDQRGKDSESEEEIVINVGNERKYKDVATQNEQQDSKSTREQTSLVSNLEQSSSCCGMTQFPAFNQSQVQNYGNQMQGCCGNNLRHPASNTSYSKGSNNYNANYQSQKVSTPISNPRFQRPSTQLINKTTRCTYCNRLGHSVNNCRSKFNCCFWCGSGGHYLRQCPERNGNSCKGDVLGGANRGSYNNIRGSFNNRGSYNNNRGSFNNRGSYNNNRGSHNNRGAFNNYRGQQYRSQSQTRSPACSQSGGCSTDNTFDNRQRNNSGPSRLN